MNDPRSNDTLPMLDRFDATHDQMRYWLGELQTLVNHMEDRGWDTWARDHARSVIDFFSHTARQHHADVDRQIFPLVSGRGDASIDTSVDRLRQDQGWLEEVTPQQGRSRPLLLSAEGRALLKQALPAWRAAQEEARQLLGEAGASALLAIARRLPAE